MNKKQEKKVFTLSEEEFQGFIGAFEFSMGLAYIYEK